MFPTYSKVDRIVKIFTGCPTTSYKKPLFHVPCSLPPN